jgi:hypothetical protein
LTLNLEQRILLFIYMLGSQESGRRTAVWLDDGEVVLIGAELAISHSPEE